LFPSSSAVALSGGLRSRSNASNVSKRKDSDPHTPRPTMCALRLHRTSRTIPQTTPSDIPFCPKCGSEYTFDDGIAYVCPECGHEWSKDADVGPQEKVYRSIAPLSRSGGTCPNAGIGCWLQPFPVSSLDACSHAATACQPGHKSPWKYPQYICDIPRNR
jgi:hypothetical protein